MKKKGKLIKRFRAALQASDKLLVVQAEQLMQARNDRDQAQTLLRDLYGAMALTNDACNAVREVYNQGKGRLPGVTTYSQAKREAEERSRLAPT